MTHAPLTPPVPIPPSIYGSDALVIWMLSTAMKAPISAPPTAIQVRIVTFAAGPLSVAMMDASVRALGAGIDRRLDRHARTEQAGQPIGQVDDDLYRNALHDLGEVAG